MANPKPLNTAWTKEIQDPEERKNFEVIIRNSTLVLSRLKAIFEEMERETYNQLVSVKDFDTPNWSHKQAHLTGDLARLKKLKELIPF